MDPEQLARSINDETVNVHAIGVDVCQNVPHRLLIPEKVQQLHRAIAADIFHSVGIQKHDAESSFRAIRERISSNRPLWHSTLDDFEGMSFIRNHSSKVMRLQARTKKIVCPPAHVMSVMIAAVAYRKLRPTTEDFFQKNKDVVKVFGELNGIQWLSVAIQVFDKVRASAFTIELDENSEKPVAEFLYIDGQSRWVVKTKMPDMNCYENILRNILYPGGPAVQPSSPKVPKPEPEDNALPSVEPNDISNEAITLSDDDETQDNTITLRDYSRQMKTLAKRLTTPDRAVAKRARREILKKPDEVGEQQVDGLGTPKEFFDSYTHLKDVWKTCLQNQVSIPNSLRVLVDHHCTPSQVFHLTELEKEHLAEVGMEIDD